MNHDTIKPSAEPIQRPASGMAGAEVYVMGKPHALWFFTVHLA
ncbi:hypothetical protein [Moritella marina]|nr:hypothetical protein [Moritella marina]